MNVAEYEKMYRLEERYWWFVARRRLALDLLRGHLDDSPPNDEVLDRPYELLDLGCGTGVLLSEADRTFRGTGADFSPTALQFCRSRGLARLALANGERLPFADGSFEAIVALDVFEHIPDDRAAFAEAARVLRPGGILVLSVPAFRWLWGPHDVALHHHRRYRASEIGRLMEDAGLRRERLSYAIFFLFPLVIVSRLLEKLRRGPERASLPKVGDGLNRFLARLIEGESRLIERGTRLPWGSSVVAVGRKPGTGTLHK